MKGTRRTGRELALKIVYSLPDQESEIDEILQDFWQNFRFREDILGEPLDEFSGPVPAEVKRFTEDLVRGVVDHLEEIDGTVNDMSTNWALERMARVDLALLRMAAFELMHRPDVPASVVINEAIEIGKRYGTKDTPSFINGILDRIARTHRPSDA